MLDAFIIEEIKRRERARQENERRREELPLPTDEDRPTRKTDREDEDPHKKTGVVIIDLSA